VIDSGEVPSDPQLFGQHSPKVRGEAWVSVSDYVAGESGPWVQVLVVQLGDLGSHDCTLAREEQRSS